VDLGIRGKVALVMGASGGIGEAVAGALAAEGATLALAARRADELERVAASCLAAGATGAHAFTFDQSERGAGARLVERASDALGAIEIVVLNGGGPKPGTFTQVPLEDWDRAYDTVLRTMIDVTQAALPAMTARGWGRVVALTSTSVKQPIGTLVLSNAFRTALVSSLKTLAGEVARFGITVNAIATGRVMTDRIRSLYGSEADAEAAARREVPIGRVASPPEFAPMVAFLCSEPARYITGQTIAVDGGLVASLF
jgi:3-oxoacyl-[acyl-carrier protein] reductase